MLAHACVKSGDISLLLCGVPNERTNEPTNLLSVLVIVHCATVIIIVQLACAQVQVEVPSRYNLIID